MTDRAAPGESETETHHEPHGAAAPHGAADDVGSHAVSAAADHDATPTADHGDGHGDGHDGEALGPIDLPAWAAGIVGVALGLVVVAGLVMATAAS